MSHGETDLERALTRWREGRRASGPAAPDEAELISYAMGELAGPEAEAVRDYLALDAEAARFVLDVRQSMSLDLPEGGAPLSAAELAADWAELEGRLAGPAAPIPFPPLHAGHSAAAASPRLAWAVAAAALLLALGFGGWGFRLSLEKARLEQEVRVQGEAQANPPYAFLEPSADHVRDVVVPSGRRPRLAVGRERSFVSLSPPARSAHEVFEIDALPLDPQVGPARSLVRGLRLDSAQRLLFSVTEHSLPPGVYQLKLYGTEGKDRRPLADYEVEVVGIAPAR